MIRIFVIDDHPVVREGLVTALRDDPDFHVVGSAGSAEEALAQIGDARPEIILLDLEMPGMDGVEAIPRLRAAADGAGVVVFTAYQTDERVLGAVRAGAQGYVLKGAAIEEIGRAVRAVHGGGSHLDPHVAGRVLAEAASPRRRGPLSPRERQVLRMLADGQATKQIARSLAITERTVKFHVRSILNKLGAETRAQAVALAVQRGLI